MLRRPLADKLFGAFHIHRWNDRIRPYPLVEMDKAAHKMILAFILGRYEEEASGYALDWPFVVEAGIFELMKKISLSDIKATVHRRIFEKDAMEYRQLNQFAVDDWAPLLRDFGGLAERFEAYLLERHDKGQPAFRVVRAAHKYSTQREFRIIERFNESTSIDEIRGQLEHDLEPYGDLQGIVDLRRQGNVFRFLEFCEHLRFQIRWGQTQRLPATSVLGHSMLVATLARLMVPDTERTEGAGAFFAGILHDIPETLTRDIISPVKRATEKLASIIKAIEDEMMEAQMMPLLPAFMRTELSFFTKDEFGYRSLDERGEGRDHHLTNAPRGTPNPKWLVPGPLVKAADELAAFLEAHHSFEIGVRSEHLHEGWTTIKRKYLTEVKPKDLPHEVDLRPLYREYRFPG